MLEMRGEMEEGIRWTWLPEAATLSGEGRECQTSCSLPIRKSDGRAHFVLDTVARV